MIKVLVFYLVLWWFTKLENKKLLIVRAVLSSSIAVFFLIGAITMFMETHIPLSAVFGIIFLCIEILFGLRAVFDIKKTIKLRKEQEKNE